MLATITARRSSPLLPRLLGLALLVLLGLLVAVGAQAGTNAARVGLPASPHVATP